MDGGVTARAVERPAAVGVRHGRDGVAARTADRGMGEGGGQLMLGAPGDAALQAVHAVDVFVQRRLAHAEALGESGESEARQADLVGELLGFLDHPGLVEPGSRHGRSPSRRS